MRTLLIDPEKRTVSEIQLAREDYKEIKRALGCQRFTIGAHLSGSYEDGFEAVYVSDDELEDRDDPRFWFQIDADRDPPGSYPIAGRGLVTSTNRDGWECDIRMSVDELRSRVTFSQRKFRGLETLTGAEAHARGADLVVEVIAPIIDGTNE